MYGGPAFSEYKIEERESSLHGAVLIGGFSDVGPGEHSSMPHRHTFVELAWLSRGSGTHTIDASTFPVHPRTLHIITPGQVHAWQPGSEEVDGILVLFKESFLAGLGTVPALTGGVAAPGPTTAARLDRLIEELHEEIRGDARDRDVVVRYLLGALVAVCARETQAPAPPRHELTRRFQEFLDGHASAKLTVSECARALHVTASHLAEIIRSDLGRTPGEAIRAAVTLEAQRRLSHTPASSAQIAAALGFHDPSYFSRFFRRESGLSPSEYRSSRGIGAV